MQKEVVLISFLFILLFNINEIGNDNPPVNFIVTIDWEKERPEIGGSDIYESIEETTLIILDIFKEHNIKYRITGALIMVIGIVFVLVLH